MDIRLRIVQRYDSTRDCWEPGKDMPVGRHMHAAAVLDGLLYVIGGHTSEEAVSTRVDRFDPTRNEWESVAPLAVGRVGLAAVTAGERISVMGGDNTFYSMANNVDAYDAANNTWTPCTQMPHGLYPVGVGVLRVDDP